MRILVVEDEKDLADAIVRGLTREGYAVDVANDGATARDKLDIHPYDLITLDLNLPDDDGRDIARDLRAAAGPGPRILMVTARDQVRDRIDGLDDGADDYLVKPFDFQEMLARVRALLRRDAPARGATMQIGEMRLDAAKRTAAFGSAALELTTKEFALLRYLMLHAGDVVSAEELLDHVWDEHADPFTNTVRVTVSNLRKKLRAAGGEDVIETVVGAGYRLEGEPA